MGPKRLVEQVSSCRPLPAAWPGQEKVCGVEIRRVKRHLSSDRERKRRAACVWSLVTGQKKRERGFENPLLRGNRLINDDDEEC